jgi:hypothetical protein
MISSSNGRVRRLTSTFCESSRARPLSSVVSHSQRMVPQIVGASAQRASLTTALAPGVASFDFFSLRFSACQDG